MSRDYVGDTAETIALIWPGGARAEPPRLADVVEALKASPARVPRLLAGLARQARRDGPLGAAQAPDRGLARRRLGAARQDRARRWSGVPLAEIEEVWHGLRPPYAELFDWLSGTGPSARTGARATFRPLMLAHPIEDKELALIEPEDFVAEWKWDGIRVQAAHQGGEMRLFSRTGDDISAPFPMWSRRFPKACARRRIAGDARRRRRALQRSATAAQPQDGDRRMLKSHPAHIRLYDMLFEKGVDLRELPFIERRARLEAWYERSCRALPMSARWSTSKI